MRNLDYYVALGYKVINKMLGRDELAHHGIKGQKWGVRNGPPYPLDRNNGNSVGDEDDDRFKGIKKISPPETESQSLIRANEQHRGKVSGKNNCVPSSIAGFLRMHGCDCLAKSTKGEAQIAGGVVEEVFKGVRASEGSAVVFSKSRQDADRMLKRKYGDNAEGLVAIDWNEGGGHAFNWIIENGNVRYLDFKAGKDDSFVEEHYFPRIKSNGQLCLARLDNCSGVDIEALKKYAYFKEG